MTHYHPDPSEITYNSIHHGSSSFFPRLLPIVSIGSSKERRTLDYFRQRLSDREHTDIALEWLHSSNAGGDQLIFDVKSKIIKK